MQGKNIINCIGVHSDPFAFAFGFIGVVLGFQAMVAFLAFNYYEAGCLALIGLGFVVICFGFVSPSRSVQI